MRGATVRPVAKPVLPNGEIRGLHGSTNRVFKINRVIRTLAARGWQLAWDEGSRLRHVAAQLLRDGGALFSANLRFVGLGERRRRLQ